MAELNPQPENEEVEAAIGCIIEALYHLLYDMINDDEAKEIYGIDDEIIAGRIARVFQIFAELTLGKLGDFTDFIAKESKRQAMYRIDYNKNEQVKLSLMQQLPRSWFD